MRWSSALTCMPDWRILRPPWLHWGDPDVALTETAHGASSADPSETSFLGYSLFMEIPATKARDQLGRLIDLAHSEPVYLTRHDRRVGAIVDADTLDRLTAAAEELEDIAAYDAAKAEEGESVTLDVLRHELGL